MEPELTYTNDMDAVDRMTILGALAAITDAERTDLLRCVDALDPSAAGEWVSEEGQWPYVRYSPEADALWQAVHDAGLMVPFDWVLWIKTVDATNLPTDDPVDAVRTITAIIRGDRFTTGVLLANLESGVFGAAVRSAISTVL